MGEHDPYSTTEGLGLRLSNCLSSLAGESYGFTGDNLSTVNLSTFGPVVERAYERIAADCTVRGKFHVGASKVLHWLFPELFIMLDRNAAMAFQEHHKIGFRRTTQPGYSAERYLKCLEKAQAEISGYGPERLLALEPNTPIARIFDKVAFVVGAGWFVAHRG